MRIRRFRHVTRRVLLVTAAQYVLVRNSSSSPPRGLRPVTEDQIHTIPNLVRQKMFDAVTRAVLEYYTTQPPATENHWYGLWVSILTTLFPASKGYIVTPQCRVPEDSERHIPDFVFEVAEVATSPMRFRTILIEDQQ
jgi:hypothetical protein